MTWSCTAAATSAASSPPRSGRSSRPRTSDGHASGHQRARAAAARHAKVCELLADAEYDLTAFYAFPREHWTKIRSTNPLEHVNKEIGRRSDVVGIFPNDQAVIRLADALLLEQNDEWPRGASMSNHLFPFALWTAFPSSLVGRCSHDYYEHSVAMELALRRRSRVRPCLTSERDVGQERYPAARALQITADCGGGNGNRIRLWKTELQQLGDDTGLTIRVCHFPPAPRSGTSRHGRPPTREG